MSVRMLVVDDERLIRWSVGEAFNNQGFDVTTTENLAEARHALSKTTFDVALLDLRLPDGDGVALMHEARQGQPEMPVIIMTAFSTVEGAVSAIKAGATDYVTKPFDIDALLITVRRALESNSLKRVVKADLKQKQALYSIASLIGETPGMVEVKDLLRRVSQSPSTTVLILGESGTGKDLAARALHYESPRAVQPFVNVTCTAIPESLLESELFGHEAGAFTNAVTAKKGLFEIGQFGTVFLDEVGDMTPLLQGKLLRVLEDKTFKRVGGTADVHVDVRIVAATNRDLAAMVQRGEFREDLFYRLNVVPVLLPPLRERPEDIPLLTDHFLQHFAREFRLTPRKLSATALRRLLEYNWPGNIREMRNVFERALLFSAGEIIDADELYLGRVPVARGDAQTLGMPPEGCTLEEAEKVLVLEAMRRHSGNLTRAGKLLGISRDQLRYKLKKYGIEY